MFEVDTESLRFVDWFIHALQTTDFDISGWFSAHTANEEPVLYFESHHHEADKLERAFPIRTDSDKLALDELLVTGGLNDLLGMQHSAGWQFKLVKHQAEIDTAKATEALEEKLPSVLAEKIVEIASDE